MSRLTSLELELEAVLGDAASDGVNTPREVGELLVYEVGAAIRAAAIAGAQEVTDRAGRTVLNYDKAFRAAIAAIQRKSERGARLSQGEPK